MTLMEGLYLLTFPYYPKPQLINHEDFALVSILLAVAVDNLVTVPDRRVDTVVEELIQGPPWVERRLLTQVRLEELLVWRITSRYGLVCCRNVLHSIHHLLSTVIGLVVQVRHLGIHVSG